MTLRSMVARAAALAVVVGCYFVLTGSAPAPGGISSTDAPADSAAVSAIPDFTAYQKLLDEFLVISSAPGAPIETRFRYATLFSLVERRDRMAAIHQQFASIHPDRLDPKLRLAWAINAYNFLVLERATDNVFIVAGFSKGANNVHYVRGRRTSVSQMRLITGGFFDAPIVTIDSTEYSLKAFEHRFVFGGLDAHAGPRAPIDARAHFALAPGTIGGPPLLGRAYRADSLDLQLDFAARNALANPMHLRINSITGVLQGSVVFSQYAPDFGGLAGMMAFVKRYAPQAVLDEMGKRGITFMNGSVPCDLSLNQDPAEVKG